MKVTPQQLKAGLHLVGLGYAASGASALTGNFSREVGPMLPSAFRKSRLDHGSQGLPQWRLDRLTNYLNFVKARAAKLSASFDDLRDSMEMQLDFVDYELRTDYPKLREKLMGGGPVAALAADVCWQYERPNRALSGIEDRIAYATAILAALPSAKAAPNVLGFEKRNPVTPGVVDHLQAAAKVRVDQQQGGIVLATVAAIGSLFVTVREQLQSLPWWEVAAFALCILGIVAGVTGAISAAHKASELRLAAAGVTAFAPKAEDVEHSPVASPGDEEQPAMSFEEAVSREVEKRMAAFQRPTDPLHPLNFGSSPDLPHPVYDSVSNRDPQGGATFSIGHAPQEKQS